MNAIFTYHITLYSLSNIILYNNLLYLYCFWNEMNFFINRYNSFRENGVKFCSIIKRDNVLASVIHCWRCTLLSSNAILAWFSPPSSLDPLRGRLRWVMAGREIVINELSCFPCLFRLPSSLHGSHPPSPFLPPLPVALYPRFLSRHSQALRFRQYVRYILCGTCPRASMGSLVRVA